MSAEVIVLNSHGVGQITEIDTLPRLGETITGYNWRIAQDGGKGSNCSISLGRLGIKTAFIGKVGNDLWGDLGETWMREAGVDVSCLIRSDEVSTGTGLILLMNDGNNTIIHGESSGCALTEDEIQRSIEHHRKARIIISGFEVPMEKALFGLKIAKQMGIYTILNPSPIPKEKVPALDFVDMLIINEQEGNALSGVDAEEESDLKPFLEKIKKEYGCRSVIMTLGAQGAVCLTEQNKFLECVAPKVKVVDSTGAGDAFAAAFAAGLIWNFHIQKALE